MKRRVQIAVVDFINAKQLYYYLGEERYCAYLAQIIKQIETIFVREHVFCDIYFEQPGYIYVIIENMEFDVEDCVRRVYGDMVRSSEKAVSSGERLIPRVCCISVPDDINDFEEIIRLGHEFSTQLRGDCLYTKASDIVASRDYGIMSHMDLILNRAIAEHKFRIYYQPIYSVAHGRFISAEALIRLIDDEYGFVSPGIFIPAAERKGVILPIGDFVLEDVHRFISENDLDKLGLEYIEVNLSVMQCLQEDLPAKLAMLGEKYGVSPDKVNLEITETTSADIGAGIMDDNLELLSGMGYTFSLDDFGTGYSNMQRVSRLPLKIIKLDKSLVDDMQSPDGLSIMRNTVKMMRDIDKELVAEGVETEENLQCLEELGCHFIQGYYFSKPLPEDEFVECLKKHNKVTA
jgi:EAL domain-containing protein (putative c-di-GMP-specific phosphodiesterase class I)